MAEVPPDDVVEAFDELASLQRGEPEDAMHDAAMFHAGVLSFCLEHVGDLTNRMAKGWHIRRHAGMGYVADKTEKVLRILKQPYGFMREHGDNVRGNAKYLGIPIREYEETLKELLERYSQAHAELPAYNDAQYAAREAAVALGRLDIRSAIEYLEYLNKLTEDKEEYEEVAYYYMRNLDGSLVVM